MSEHEINILLRLRDEFSASAKKVESSLKGLSNNLNNLSSQMRIAGRNMQYLGGAITGVFGIALNTATKYSFQAEAAMNKFKTAIIHLQITIATAVLPTVYKLANAIGTLVKRFQDLNPVIRNNIISAVLLTRVWLTVGGTFTRVISAILKLFALLAKHPALIIFIGFTFLLIKHWEQVRDVVIPVLNGMEIGLSAVAIGFAKVAKAMAMVVKMHAELPFVFGGKKVAGFMEGQIKEIDAFIKTFEANVLRIYTTNKGVITDTIAEIEKLIEEFRKLSEDFNLDDLTEKFDGLKTIIANTAKEMSQLFGDLFFKILTNQLEDAKSMFTDFANQILRMIAQVLIRMLLIRTIGEIGLGRFGKLGKYLHQGGVIKAHSGLATDEVPIIAQTGEGILSRRGMQTLGRGNFDRLNRGEGIGGEVNYNPVVIIQAWDTRDIHRNRKMIESIIADAMERNSSVVRAKIKKYG